MVTGNFGTPEVSDDGFGGGVEVAERERMNTDLECRLIAAYEQGSANRSQRVPKGSPDRC